MMRARHGLWLALSFGALVLSGCAVPDDPPSAPSTPVGPPPSSAAEPALLLDGDCAALLPDDLPAELGAPTPVETPAAIGVATLGGISCAYGGPTSVLVDAFPRSVVPEGVAARYTEPVCEAFGRDGQGCRVARIAGGTWVLTTLAPSGGSSDEVPPDLLAAVADAVAARVADAAPGEGLAPSEDWWMTSCADLADRLDLDALVGAGAESGPPGGALGSAGVADEIAMAAGTQTGPCVWTADGGSIDVRLFPGGAWAVGTHVEDVEVAGAVAAGQREDGLYEVSDGVNLLVADVATGASPSSGLTALLEALAD